MNHVTNDLNGLIDRDGKSDLLRVQANRDIDSNDFAMNVQQRTA